MFRCTILIALFAFSFPSFCRAEVVTIEGTIKSVDETARTITVETDGEATTLDVSRKAKVDANNKEAELDFLKPGQKVKLSYHDDLEIVLKIEVTSSSGGEEIRLFDGKSLEGWRGDAKYWKVQDGAIVGTLPRMLPGGGTFLATKASFENFVLKARFKLYEGNSGIQFRSQQLGKNRLSGYQADIAYQSDFKYLGWLTTEKMGVGKIAETTANVRKRLGDSINRSGWNDYVIMVRGDRITLEINGQKTVDVHHDGPVSGVIGFQLHGGVPTKVAFKDITIKLLP